jgi:imidazoleglycerol-phosphate dehydratase
MLMGRTARIERTTKESTVVVELDLDGTGTSTIETPPSRSVRR